MHVVLGVLFLVLMPVRLTAQDTAAMSNADLIRTYVAIQDELRARGIATSGNSLTGQLGEYLFIRAFGWEPVAESRAGFDALGGPDRIQIKARRLSQGAGNEQLGAIRNLEGFDVLAVVLFSHDYDVVVASLIPVDVVRSFVEFDSHTNSWRLMYSDALREHAGVIDVSSRLQALEF